MDWKEAFVTEKCATEGPGYVAIVAHNKKLKGGIPGQKAESSASI